MAHPGRKKMFIPIISCLFVLLAAEVIMRLSWRMSGWVERPIYQRSANPYLRYELVPGASSGNIRVNSDGFRGPDYPIVKPEGVFRIIMLGDSETLSIMLSERESLAAQLEDQLNQGLANPRYEALNFGVEGYNTFQELEQLRVKGLKYKPDLIILNYVLNDPEPGEYYFNKTFLMRHSALARYFTYRIKKALIRRERKRLGIKTEVEHFYYLHQPKYFQRVEGAIREIAGISRAAGNKLAVVIFPVSSLMVPDFKEGYPYSGIHALVNGIRSDNILFIDLIDEFNRLDLTPQGVSINYIYNESHKNAPALKTAAQYLSRLLRANKIVPE